VEHELEAMPWIPFAARAFLDGLLRPTDRVWEWGAGGSSLYFAERAAAVVSVEEDANWRDFIADELAARSLGNVDLRLIPPVEGVPGEDVSDPACYCEPHREGLSYRDYVVAIDGEAGESLDLVFVDGAARPSCIAHALPKLRPGGWLVLDNSDRDYYLTQVGALLAGWARRAFHGPGPYNSYEWSCAFWRKPK
jgi:hypothetical protein